MEQLNSFRKLEKAPSPVEMEAARKAAEKALKEKEKRLAKEQEEHRETERMRHLHQAEQPPYVITKEDIGDAEEKIGKEFEKLN